MPTTGRSRSAASRDRTTSARCARRLTPIRACRAGGRAGRELLAHAEPRGRRWWKGAARRRTRRDGGARPAAGRGHRAREARGGGLRSWALPSDRPRPLQSRPPAPPAHSATRRIASRSVTTASKRGARSMETIFEGLPGSAPCAVARSSGTSAPSSGSSRRRRRSSKAFPGCRRRRRARSTRSSTRQAA